MVAVVPTAAGQAPVPSIPRPARSAEEVVRAARALLPERPALISLIDLDAQQDPRVREALRPLEAFILPSKKDVVYLNLQGATLQRAITTRDERLYRFDLHVLAAMVWHEMGHLAGADEPTAQAREEQLWKQFIRDGRVDQQLGLQQLQIYRARRRR